MIKKLAQLKFTMIISVLILATFISYMLRSESTFSETENRYLAARPEVTLSTLADGSFMRSFELYTEEQLPLRDMLVKLKAVIGELMLKNENNGIARGKDGRLFEKLVSYDKQLDKNKAAIRNFAGGTDRDIYVCIVPNSCQILKDYTPAGFPGISQKAQIDDLYDMLKMYSNVHTIDLNDTLSEHEDEYIYYRTDHHWTTEGAYIGYCKLCKDMGIEAIDIQKDEIKEKLKKADDFYGTYQSKYRGIMGIRPDTITYYDIPVGSYEAGGKKHDSLYDTDKLETYDKYAMFMYGNEGLGTVETSSFGDTSRRKELLLFKDSYANCLIPFFTFNYDRITIVDLRYYAEPVKDLIKEHEDADILLMYNFMHFSEDNHFYRLTS